MTKFKHTPGPWIHDKITGEIYVKLDNYYKKRIGSVSVQCADHDNQEENANANLIAAAPELLEELEQIVKGWQHCYTAVRSLTPWEEERLKFAEQAIKKAKGE